MFEKKFKTIFICDIIFLLNKIFTMEDTLLTIKKYSLEIVL